MREVTVTPAEIREVFETVLEGGFPFKAKQRSNMSDCVAGWRATSGPRVKWQGVTGKEMSRMLDEGYFPDGDAPDLTMADREVENVFMDLVEEDGDLLIEAALGGEDLLYASWEEDPAKRGLTIRFNAAFTWTTPVKVMLDYYAWVLRIVDAAERRGIAPDVEIFYDNRTNFNGDGNLVTRIVIPVVEAGQLVDVSAWRAFLHGSSYRTLGFASMAVAADKLGKTCAQNKGFPTGNKWDVEFDGDTLTILSPNGADSFPEATMTAKVDAALAADPVAA